MSKRRPRALAIRFESPNCVRLTGKGRKERICPLWPETVMLLKKLPERQPRAPDQRLFVNRYGEPLSASGVRFKLAAYVKAAAETMPTLRARHVTPHAFRHYLPRPTMSSSRMIPHDFKGLLKIM